MSSPPPFSPITSLRQTAAVDFIETIFSGPTQSVVRTPWKLSASAPTTTAPKAPIQAPFQNDRRSTGGTAAVDN